MQAAQDVGSTARPAPRAESCLQSSAVRGSGAGDAAVAPLLALTGLLDAAGGGNAGDLAASGLPLFVQNQTRVQNQTSPEAKVSAPPRGWCYHYRGTARGRRVDAARSRRRRGV